MAGEGGKEEKKEEDIIIQAARAQKEAAEAQKALAREQRENLRGQREAAKAQSKAARAEEKAKKEEEKATEEEEKKEPKEEGRESSPLRTYSLILIILGVLYLILFKQVNLGIISFPGYFTGTFLQIVFNFVLLFFAILAMLEHQRESSGRVSSWGAWIVIIVVLVWFFGFKGNMWSTIILGIMVAGVVGYYLKAYGEEGGETLMAVAWPLLVFFLDMVVPWVFNVYGNYIPEVVQDIAMLTILSLPWWLLLGIILYPVGEKDTFASIAKPVAIIIIVLGLVLPLIPEYGGSFLPGVEELSKAQKEMESFTPETEPLLWSNLKCLGDPLNVEACAVEEQLKSKLRWVCKYERELKEGTDAYKKCLTEEREKEKNKDLKTESVIVQRKPIQAEFNSVDYQIEETRKEGEEFKVEYPVMLEVVNPSENPVEVEVTCNLKKSSTEEILPAKISDKSTFTVKKEEPLLVRMECQPADALNLKGKYSFIFEAELKNLVTVTELTRVFVGKEKDDAWKEEWYPALMQSHFSNKKYLSQAPQDPAFLSFALGMREIKLPYELNSLYNIFKSEDSTEFPFIEGEGEVVLSKTIRNNGKGKITKINYYELRDFNGFVIDEEDTSKPCFNAVEVKDEQIGGWDESKSIYRNIGDKEIYLSPCTITALPLELAEPISPLDPVSFEGELNYNYLIRKEFPFTFKTEVSEG